MSQVHILCYEKVSCNRLNILMHPILKNPLVTCWKEWLTVESKISAVEWL